MCVYELFSAGIWIRFWCLCFLFFYFFLFFFFSSRRRHTRWNCDWSSDVCSSDLSRVIVAINLEYGCLLVLVDRDDDPAVLHPREMLDRTRDPHGDIELGRDDLAGLPYLPVVRDEARIDGSARRAHRRPQLVGERLEQLEVVPRAHAAAAGY